MEPTFALPDQLRNDMATPSSLDCNVEQSVVTPLTGQGAVYVQDGNCLTINLPNGRNDCVFDPMNSY